jgi:hypothetical protein
MPQYPHIEVRLIGQATNQWSVLTRCCRAANDEIGIPRAQHRLRWRRRGFLYQDSSIKWVAKQRSPRALKLQAGGTVMGLFLPLLTAVNQ